MKIVAVGGGEIGRPGFPIETEKIDKETVRLSGKKHPKLLFIPTASSDSEGYAEVVRNYFGKRLGCRVDVLYLIQSKLSKPEIKKKIFNSDIIYVGGGNTLKMMKIWRRFGVDKILTEAAQKGVVLSGVSAGAICWFKYANSDSRRFVDPDAPMIRVKGLGLLNALGCPHYNGERERKPALKKMMRNTPGVGIALDNCTALEIIDDTFRVIRSKPDACAYRVYWSKNKYNHESLACDGKLTPLKDLFKRS